MAGLLASRFVNKLPYAVGGKNSSTKLATAEAYNPQTDRWEAVAPMSGARFGLALAVM